MKKQDLKTGTIVETRCGERATVLIDNVNTIDAIVFNTSNWTDLSDFSEDLQWHKEDKNRTEHTLSVDIMKVYKPSTPAGSIGQGYKDNYSNTLTLLWERAEAEELTLEQICKELGRDIKIVK